MEAEHCSLGGVEQPFTNKNTTTWPAKEWAITVRGDHSQAHVGSSGSRELRKIEDLMKEDVVSRAGLTRPEVIAVVLYTGPMVSQTQCCSRKVPISTFFP
jgi:hypothetical protein